MNYYNPYLFANPYIYSANAVPKVGLLSRIFGSGTSLSTILSGTQKTLNVVNQAIPIIKQAGPMINNAKTMFKVMNEFKRIDMAPTKQNYQLPESKVENHKTNEIQKKEPTSYEAGPMFFQ